MMACRSRTYVFFYLFFLYISVCRPSTNNARIKRVIALIKADSLRRTHDKTLRLCERTFRNGKKGEIVKKVMEDVAVLSSWSLVARDMERKVGDELLKMIVEEWVKIRGFSFAGSWLELYKQRTKKTLQRSKGLRKVLIAPDGASTSQSETKS